MIRTLLVFWKVYKCSIYLFIYLHYIHYKPTNFFPKLNKLTTFSDKFCINSDSRQSAVSRTVPILQARPLDGKAKTIGKPTHPHTSLSTPPPHPSGGVLMLSLVCFGLSKVKSARAYLLQSVGRFLWIFLLETSSSPSHSTMVHHCNTAHCSIWRILRSKFKHDFLPY